MKPLILTPAYTPKHPALDIAIQESGIESMTEHGYSDLPGIRSIMLSAVMRMDVSRVILIDADIIPTVEQIQYLANTFNVNDTQAVTGMYLLKNGCIAVNPKQPSQFCVGEKALRPCVGAGLGFMAISRASLVRVMEDLPLIRLDGTAPWYPFCLPMTLPLPNGDATYLPDDFALCHRLTSTGTRIMCQTDLTVGHACGAVSVIPNDPRRDEPQQ